MQVNLNGQMFDFHNRKLVRMVQTPIDVVANPEPVPGEKVSDDGVRYTENQVDLTLGFAALEILAADIPGDTATFEEKNVRYELARRIQASVAENVPTVMSTEEASVLKNMFGRVSNALIVGHLNKVIEG